MKKSHNNSNIKDKWLYFPIIVMAIYFVIRLVNQSKIINTFPLDYTNDWSAYIAQLFFLKECGFHNFCSYWYNGFETFLSTSPSWYFFTLPIYWITNNVLAATFISLIIIYIIGFIVIYFLGKQHGFSKTKIITFFLFFFANAIAIGNFIRLGRITSLFSFVILISIASLCLYYKSKKLDYKFALFIILYFIMLLSHKQEMILSHFIIAGLFLSKKRNKEKLTILIYGAISILLASFWLIPFIKNIPSTLIQDLEGKRLLLDLFSRYELFTNIVAIAIPLSFLVLFYLYRKTYSSKGEFYFFLPSIILSILFMLKITAFLPLLNNISPDPFILYFLFLSIFLLFKLDFNILNKNLRIAIPILLIIFSIASVAISAYYTPYFKEHTQLDKDTLSILSDVEGRLMISLNPGTSYNKAYYSYAPIYANLTTVYGWYPYLTTQSYLDLYNETINSFYNENCSLFISGARELNATVIVSNDESCDFLESCGLTKINRINQACAYSLN